MEMTKVEIKYGHVATAERFLQGRFSIGLPVVIGTINADPIVIASLMEGNEAIMILDLDSPKVVLTNREHENIIVLKAKLDDEQHIVAHDYTNPEGFNIRIPVVNFYTVCGTGVDLILHGKALLNIDSRIHELKGLGIDTEFIIDVDCEEVYYTLKFYDGRNLLKEDNVLKEFSTNNIFELEAKFKQLHNKGLDKCKICGMLTIYDRMNYVVSEEALVCEQIGRAHV